MHRRHQNTPPSHLLTVHPLQSTRQQVHLIHPLLLSTVLRVLLILSQVQKGPLILLRAPGILHRRLRTAQQVLVMTMIWTNEKFWDV